VRLKLPKSKERLRREASNWLARLQSSREGDAELKFRRWYEADRAHAEAFDRVRKSYDSAGLLRELGARGERPAAGAGAPRQATRHRFAAAAAIALLLAGALTLTGGRILWPGPTDVLMVTTAVGEIRAVRLADGSRVILDTASSLELEVSRTKRHAVLKRGRARFEIGATSGSFVIEAGAAAVSAPNGVLDIERTAAGTRVEILAGQAEVRTGEAQKILLGPGKEVTVDRHSLQARDGSKHHGWTNGMLEFDATPLGSAVELANRYSDRRIVLGPDLDRLRVSGAFRAGDTAGLAKALAAAFGLSLRSAKDGTLILTGTSPAAL
jgi:transmembrane sensor